MHDILLELNREVGVQGILVVAPDGVIIDAALKVVLPQDLVAAVASEAVLNLKKKLQQLQIEKFSCFAIESSFGKIIFMDAGIAYLVAVLEKGINLDTTMIAIEGAVHRIKSAVQIKV
ncbi:MAG: roadblock/LC7 domain-containing protein [Planctomycetota bacterium]